MPIPKVIHQTFKTKKLPFITRWHISRMLKRNPGYAYEFYDDERIEEFLLKEFDEETLTLYQRLNIGAAKADFFRYAVLLKKGGIYLDIDCKTVSKFSAFIKTEDEAIITRERNPEYFVQWGLIYSPGHPFLRKTVELTLDNIRTNRYPNDVHQMTGPSVYTIAIEESIKANPDIAHRVLGIDYQGHIKPKYKLSKFFLYKPGMHWKDEQKIKPVLKTDA